VSTRISIVVPYISSGEILKLWTQVRVSKDHLNGLQEFPGGKVESGETLERAGRREVQEEVGINLEKIKLFRTYSFPNKLEISVFLYNDVESKFEMAGYENIDLLMNNLDRIPPNNIKILKDLDESLKKERI
jgi:8-oxo-dGTP diphosphatase